MLSLDGNYEGITDAGLASLRKLGALERLDLDLGDGCRVTDEGVARLRALPNLRALHIGLPEDQKGRVERWRESPPGVKIA